MLSDGNIVLRPPELSDLERLYVWENDIEVWLVSSTTSPFSRKILAEFIENAHKDIYEYKQLRLMIDYGNSTIGCVDLFDFDPQNMRVGIGILIADHSLRYKGIASSVIKIIKKYCFEVLLLNQLFCNISEDNEASIRLFEKAGFKQNGVKKQWIRRLSGYKDEYFYQFLFDDYKDEKSGISE